MRVRFTLDAAAQISARREWWRDHRDKAPELFDIELAEAIERLGRTAGSLPVFAMRSGRTIRRYLMPKTRCHLYLQVIEASAEVLVLSAGGGQRKRPPRFRFQESPGMPE